MKCHDSALSQFKSARESGKGFFLEVAHNLRRTYLVGVAKEVNSYMYVKAQITLPRFPYTNLKKSHTEKKTGY